MTDALTDEWLPDIITWNIRRPTMGECELVGRSTGYAVPRPVFLSDEGDTVIETSSNPEAQAHLASAFESFGMCAKAHVIPAGVYLEE